MLTGGAGFLGSFVTKKLKAMPVPHKRYAHQAAKARGCKDIFIPTEQEYDLTKPAAIKAALDQKVGQLDQKVGQLDQKVGQLDQKVGQLDKTVLSLAIELAKTQTDVREIKYNMATNMATKDDVRSLITHIDAFAAEALSHRNHDTLRGGKVMEHESKLENHETRLTSLESK